MTSFIAMLEDTNPVVIVLLLACLLVMFVAARPKKTEFKMTRTEPLPVQEPLSLEEQEAKSKRELRYMRLRRERARSVLHHVPHVEFDPSNKEHIKALGMLMEEPARLHPSLRFHYNTSLFDNAYSACLYTTAKTSLKERSL